jgi:hypothetical protein
VPPARQPSRVDEKIFLPEQPKIAPLNGQWFSIENWARAGGRSCGRPDGAAAKRGAKLTDETNLLSQHHGGLRGAGVRGGWL